jgi:tRNA threonylcarbamoyladenosine biosynthesis protein TsaE
LRWLSRNPERWISRSPEDTREAARGLARALRGRGLVIALVGPLGAGKTAFVQGLAEGLGIGPAPVASPTFVLASEYVAPGGLRLAHVDLYRIESAAELDAAGFRDLLAPEVVLAVEWADRFPEALPADRLELRIARAPGDPGTQREILAVGLGSAADRVLARWSAGRGPSGSRGRHRARGASER